MNYGRNFSFRVPPLGVNRASGAAPTSADLPQGAPVKFTATVNALGLRVLELAAATDIGAPGAFGIVAWEATAGEAFKGFDPLLTDLSDLVDVPRGLAAQVVNGTNVEVVLRNTATTTFLGARTYAAKNLVAPANLSGIVVGDFLRPHATPSNANGYWQKVAAAEPRWLLVTSVDTARGEVTARLQF